MSLPKHKNTSDEWLYTVGKLHEDAPPFKPGDLIAFDGTNWIVDRVYRHWGGQRSSDSVQSYDIRLVAEDGQRDYKAALCAYWYYDRGPNFEFEMIEAGAYKQVWQRVEQSE